ncbi:MAG TPA: RNA polymerase sigma factor [Thermoanaerobaculia bacterium]|nr:RNA polymerase sigma factor [Thermoanaerobaculia bacterium]
MRDAFHERALLDSLGDGDDSAFWTLWQQYRQHLYQVCLRQMNGAQFDAADAVSRSMMMARTKLPAYATQIDNLEAWLTRLTCNICLDMHRERQRATHGRVSIDESTTAEDPALSCRHSPEDDYLAGEVRHVIARALGELPPVLRDAANLRFVQEMSYPVMARTLAITVENARKRVQQARAILRDRIKRELET